MKGSRTLGRPLREEHAMSQKASIDRDVRHMRERSLSIPRATILVAVIAAALAPRASATTVLPLTLGDMVRESETVIVGIITTAQARWLDRRDRRRRRQSDCLLRLRPRESRNPAQHAAIGTAARARGWTPGFRTAARHHLSRADRRGWRWLR